jgi:hypothetical protein
MAIEGCVAVEAPTASQFGSAARGTAKVFREQAITQVLGPDPIDQTMTRSMAGFNGDLAAAQNATTVSRAPGRRHFCVGKTT